MRTRTSWLSIPALALAGLAWGGCAHNQAAVLPSSTSEAGSTAAPQPMAEAAKTAGRYR